MKRLNFISILCSLLLCVIAVSGCASDPIANPNNVKLDTKSPVTISIWHYYNGAQQEAFDTLVSEFNDTRGKEIGIIVESFSQGNVSDLEQRVIESASRKIGSGEMPSIFAAYADTAYAVDRLGYAVDLEPYLTAEEIDSFIPSYIEEGKFTDDSGIKIFPIAKSIEIYMLNKTDWDKFSQATGTDIAELSTIEGITATAKKYYEWTDAMTDAPEDGKAFFGRDAMANYLIIGAVQQNHEITSIKDGEIALDFSHEAMRKIWDNYYVPTVCGYFASYGRFRSDDVKTGNIISFVGSSSGATFFPEEVILSDNESYPIEMLALECPRFAGSEKYAVQQGAGMVVTKKSDKEVYASVQFLKWLTLPERNIQFSVESGYLPVTKEANDIDLILENVSEGNAPRANIIKIAVNTVNGNIMYTPKAFKDGAAVRAILDTALSDICLADRAVVAERIASGMSLSEAAAEYLSDEYFNSWYDKTKSQLEAFFAD
jgi:hypothetical protein